MTTDGEAVGTINEKPENDRKRKEDVYVQAQENTVFAYGGLLAFSLAVQAAALAPRIESVKETADGRYTVEGSIDGYDGASFGQLYAATYDESGRMTGVDSVTPDENGDWSFTGGESSGGMDMLKAFAVADQEDGLAPLGRTTVR